jgi:hypothetical protein
MIFWTLIGIVIGYFFKPQIDRLIFKTVRMIKDKQNNRDYRSRGY